MNSSEKWFLCQLTTAPDNIDVASNWLLDNGCEGVQIEDTAIVFDQSEDATLVQREEAVLTGYRREDATQTLEDLAAALQSAPFEADLHIEEVQSQDWATQWRENFPPLEIGPFLIVPSWEEAATEGKIELRLDPGLAFGTGQHPTTRMCLELLGEQLQDKAGVRLLDVGCGSGILSLAAAKLGAQVVASDLDEWCIAATKENAEVNNVQVETHLNADLNWVTEPFPFVIANLMSDLLIRLAPELARVTQSGGTLVVSGISAPRADEVEAALNGVGYKTLHKRELNGETRGEGPEGWTERWSAFVFQKA